MENTIIEVEHSYQLNIVTVTVVGKVLEVVICAILCAINVTKFDEFLFLQNTPKSMVN